MSQIRPNFTLEELQCKCGCGRMEFSDGFLDMLQGLREVYGKPMVITSGYRCPEHNARVSSTGADGPHTKGAVDVQVHGEDAYDLIEAAFALGWSGFGVKQHGDLPGRFVHLDRLREGPRPRVWSYA